MSSRQESTLGVVMSIGDLSDGWRNSPELPNHKIEVRIQLKRILDNSLLASLKSDLDNDGMDQVQVDAKFNNAIVVSGIPPEHGYDRNNVLTKVKTHDAGAFIIPPT